MNAPPSVVPAFAAPGDIAAFFNTFLSSLKENKLDAAGAGCPELKFFVFGTSNHDTHVFTTAFCGLPSVTNGSRFRLVIQVRASAGGRGGTISVGGNPCASYGDVVRRMDIVSASGSVGVVIEEPQALPFHVRDFGVVCEGGADGPNGGRARGRGRGGRHQDAAATAQFEAAARDARDTFAEAAASSRGAAGGTTIPIVVVASAAEGAMRDDVTRALSAVGLTDAGFRDMGGLVVATRFEAAQTADEREADTDAYFQEATTALGGATTWVTLEPAALAQPGQAPPRPVTDDDRADWISAFRRTEANAWDEYFARIGAPPGGRPTWSLGVKGVAAWAQARWVEALRPVAEAMLSAADGHCRRLQQALREQQNRLAAEVEAFAGNRGQAPATTDDFVAAYADTFDRVVRSVIENSAMGIKEAFEEKEAKRVLRVNTRAENTSGPRFALPESLALMFRQEEDAVRDEIGRGEANMFDDWRCPARPRGPIAPAAAPEDDEPAFLGTERLLDDDAIRRNGAMSQLLRVALHGPAAMVRALRLWTYSLMTIPCKDYTPAELLNMNGYCKKRVMGFDVLGVAAQAFQETTTHDSRGVTIVIRWFRFLLRRSAAEAKVLMDAHCTAVPRELRERLGGLSLNCFHTAIDAYLMDIDDTFQKSFRDTFTYFEPHRMMQDLALYLSTPLTRGERDTRSEVTVRRDEEHLHTQVPLHDQKGRATDLQVSYTLIREVASAGRGRGVSLTAADFCAMPEQKFEQFLEDEVEIERDRINKLIQSFVYVAKGHVVRSIMQAFQRRLLDRLPDVCSNLRAEIRKAFAAEAPAGGDDDGAPGASRRDEIDKVLAQLRGARAAVERGNRLVARWNGRQGSMATFDESTLMAVLHRWEEAAERASTARSRRGHEGRHEDPTRLLQERRDELERLERELHARRYPDDR